MDKIVVRFILFITCLGVIVFFSFAASHWFGKRDSQDAMDRIVLVWKAPLSLPERDRLLLAGLAIACRLHEAPMAKEAVIECLRNAANSPDLEFNEPGINASTDFERLLKKTDD
jgi:hypothetical protein